jgi:hypothetical protein
MYLNSKRQGIAVLVGFAALVLMMGNAWAQARRTTVTCSVDTDPTSPNAGDITVNFDISGVGNGNLCVVSTTQYTANCACQNNGGNCPSDAKKQTTTFPASAGQAFAARNGQISGTETLTAPSDASCASVLSCPGSQDPILAELEVGRVNVGVFEPGTYTGTNPCVPNTGATPIRTGSCRLSEDIVLNESCADLF